MKKTMASLQGLNEFYFLKHEDISEWCENLEMIANLKT
jgi:hypothetical protein